MTSTVHPVRRTRLPTLKSVMGQLRDQRKGCFWSQMLLVLFGTTKMLADGRSSRSVPDDLSTLKLMTAAPRVDGRETSRAISFISFGSVDRLAEDGVRMDGHNCKQSLVLIFRSPPERTQSHHILIILQG